MSPARPRLSEEQQQQRELSARRDLEQLVELLAKAAYEIYRDSKFTGRDRALAWGRAATLFATLDRLLRVLLDQPGADVRADLLIDLHDALEAATILAPDLKAPVAHRLRTAARRGKKAARDDRRRDIVAKVAGPTVQKWPRRTAWWIAGEIENPVNDELEEHDLGRMGRDAIVDHLKVLWHHLR